MRVLGVESRQIARVSSLEVCSSSSYVVFKHNNLTWICVQNIYMILPFSVKHTQECEVFFFLFTNPLCDVHVQSALVFHLAHVPYEDEWVGMYIFPHWNILGVHIQYALQCKKNAYFSPFQKLFLAPGLVKTR